MLPKTQSTLQLEERKTSASSSVPIKKIIGVKAVGKNTQKEKNQRADVKEKEKKKKVKEEKPKKEIKKAKTSAKDSLETINPREEEKSTKNSQ